jgi:hypothetical protein
VITAPNIPSAEYPDLVRHRAKTSHQSLTPNCAI